MKIKPGQIYVGPVELRAVNYSRPFLVLQKLPAEVVICCLSTKFALKKPADLTLFTADPSFSDTGLKEESFLVHSSIHAESLELFAVSKLKGWVTKETKERVEEWWGAALE